MNFIFANKRKKNKIMCQKVTVPLDYLQKNHLWAAEAFNLYDLFVEAQN